MQQVRRRLPLQLPPQVISSEQKWHIIRVLKIGLPNHSRLAMRTPSVVAAWELIDPQNARSALGQLVTRRATHAAGTENDYVEGVHGRRGKRSLFDELKRPKLHKLLDVLG